MRLTYKGWQLHVGLTHSQQMLGVNSNLPDGKHFIMWDFDNCQLDNLSNILSIVQSCYNLPNIYILSTGTEGHYHAYCFKRVSWVHLITMLMQTPLLDRSFLQVGFLRRYLTLRISPKNDCFITIQRILRSHIDETVDKTQFPQLVKYWTKRV